MEVRQYVVGNMMENAYLLIDEETGKMAVIDPGFPDRELMDAVEADREHIEMILLTHGHFDHIGAVRRVRELTGAPVYAAAEELPLLEDGRKNMSAIFGTSEEITGVKPLKDEDTLQLGTLTIHAIHTPGHTPGGMCYRVGDAVFTGDTLFAGSVGRTDFWGGDSSMILRSVERLTELPGDYRLFPGHMEVTTLEQERRHNPYCRKENR